MITEIVGERLRNLIKISGKQQQEIALILKIKIPTFNGYIVGKREPPVEKLVQFANYFNVTVDYLVGKSDITNPYLEHLTETQRDFILDPKNKSYIDLAMDIKTKVQKNA